MKVWPELSFRTKAARDEVGGGGLERKETCYELTSKKEF